LAGNNVGYLPPTNHTFNVVGTGSDTIAFSFRNDPSYYNLDNISVSAVAPVPEPATWAMMLVGLGAIGFMARRRQNVSVAYA